MLKIHFISKECTSVLCPYLTFLFKNTFTAAKFGELWVKKFCAPSAKITVQAPENYAGKISVKIGVVCAVLGSLNHNTKFFQFCLQVRLLRHMHRDESQSFCSFDIFCIVVNKHGFFCLNAVAIQQ